MATRYLTKKVHGRTVLLHRYVWEQAHGPIPEGLQVHHVNGDRYDNRLENLALLSAAEHSRHHNDRHPRTKRCVSCGREFAPSPTKRKRALTCSRPCFIALMRTKRQNAKLTREDYSDIQRRIADGEPQKDIADAYAVSPATITRIKKMRLDQEDPDADQG